MSGLARSATGALRALLDAAYFANLPGGFRSVSYTHLDVYKRQAKAPLKDAAAVNAARWALVNRLQVEIPVTTGSGGRTKFNRTRQGFAKDHWIDAACVGESGERVSIREGTKPLVITAKGWGTHQVVRTDKFGFPRGKSGRIKRVFGFSTGDLVRLNMPKGKYAGIYVAPVSYTHLDVYKRQILCLRRYLMALKWRKIPLR